VHSRSGIFLTRAGFDMQRGPDGALLIGNAAASLPHAKLIKAIETIGTRVAPLVRDA
jgi:hypothetical protein